MLRGMTGELIYTGKTLRTIQECFIETTELPSWMTLSGTAPTIEFVDLTNDYGGIRLKTGAALNNVATINVLPSGIRLDKLKEFILEVDSLVFNSPNIIFEISLLNASGTKGFRFADHSSDDAIGTIMAAKHWQNGETSKRLHYDALDNDEYKRRRNLKLHVRSDMTIAMSEGDSVFGQFTFATTQVTLDEVLFPKISVKTTAAADNYCKFSRVGVTLVHN